ncbi:uncharacterized protein METZ01_LOCUS170621, partial [marine metagenome]
VDLLTVIRGNEQLQKFYASRKCKECVGRGWKDITTPERQAPERVLCHCIVKKAKGELKDG